MPPDRTAAYWARINDQRIAQLDARLQPLARELLALAAGRGWPLVVTCGYRSPDEQQARWAEGRTLVDGRWTVTAPGKVVTWAQPGQSPHQHRLAFDVAPLVDGRPAWPDRWHWPELGAIGRNLGLAWGGDFKRFPDRPHFEAKAWRSLVASVVH